MQALVFRDTQFEIVDRDGQPWLRLPQVGVALGYANPYKVQQVYDRNADEFTEKMTAVVELETAGGKQQVRIFSLRGAHLLGMFARTEPAKEFRHWVLDVLEGVAEVPAKVKPKKPKALPNGLTTEQQSAIKGLVKARLESVPKDKQAKAAITCWSSLKSKFGCTYKEIAPDQFTDAISLLARIELEGEWLPKQAEVQASANTLDELDLAMLYVFCIDTLELVYVGEKLNPVFETLRAPLTMNVRKCLSECREAVAHLHERFGSQMEQAARRRNAFDGRLNLAAAGDLIQPIWVQHRA